MKKTNFLFDKAILKYQSFTDKEKLTVDYIIKGAFTILLIVLIFKMGNASGEYLYNVGIEI